MNRATIARLFCIATSITLASPIVCMGKQREELGKKIELYIHRIYNFPNPFISDLTGVIAKEKIDPALFFSENDLINTQQKIKETNKIIIVLKNYIKNLLLTVDNECAIAKKLLKNPCFPAQKNLQEKLFNSEGKFSENKIEESIIKKCDSKRSFKYVIQKSIVYTDAFSDILKRCTIREASHFFEFAQELLPSLKTKKKLTLVNKVVSNELTLAKKFKQKWNGSVKDWTGRKMTPQETFDPIFKLGNETLKRINLKLKDCS